MEVKLIELRDKGTFIPMLAIKLTTGGVMNPQEDKDTFLLRRAGYSREQIVSDIQKSVGLEPYVLFTRLDGAGEPCNYDSFNWRNPRTYGTAHRFLIEHWEEIESGAVVDVEHILGETPVPKESEMLTTGHHYR